MYVGMRLYGVNRSMPAVSPDVPLPEMGIAKKELPMLLLPHGAGCTVPAAGGGG